MPFQGNHKCKILGICNTQLNLLAISVQVAKLKNSLLELLKFQNNCWKF